MVQLNSCVLVDWIETIGYEQIHSQPPAFLHSKMSRILFDVLKHLQHLLLARYKY